MTKKRAKTVMNEIISNGYEDIVDILKPSEAKFMEANFLPRIKVLIDEYITFSKINYKI